MTDLYYCAFEYYLSHKKISGVSLSYFLLRTESSLSDLHLSTSLVFAIISKLNLHKVCGPGGIPAIDLRKCALKWVLLSVNFTINTWLLPPLLIVRNRLL